MPTYEYRCEACGYEFERFQSMTDSAIRKCPECRKLKVKRLISSGAGVIFKGSGFYETDYRSGDYKKDASKEKTSSPCSSCSEGASCPNADKKINKKE